jgi:2-(1,2-epoxy-1,2-dihydrophenyl)acetyl-CoA isomerase
MTYETLIVERDGPVAVVTLNRPEKLNALNATMWAEIESVCAALRDDDAIRVLVWTGAGRGFCSGADLSGGRAEREGPPPQGERLDEYGTVGRLALAVYTLDKPSIAAVNGAAAGGGLGLALACDLRVGSEKSRFITAFIDRSLSPDSGVSFFLPRLAGYSRAADLIYTGRPLDAEEAFRIGVLDRLVPHERLMEETLALAATIAAKPPLALRSAKRVLQRSAEQELPEALRGELTGLNYSLRAPRDREESIRSFLEKRAPRFSGE